MRQADKDTEAWKRMVLRSMPKPAWLSEDAPEGDVVLSSRMRVMRNLRAHRFPNRADESELMQIMSAVLEAAREVLPLLEVFKGLTNAERDHLVGCRLVSPDFEWTLPGRAFLVDAGRSISLMINEEDHLRIQALSAGWSLRNCERTCYECLDALESKLQFAFSPEFGFLSASPFNCGEGRRLSGMFHLIGLAHERRLPSVIKALAAKGIAVRGLFGESSRAIGAFAQVSTIGANRTEFAGACDYLVNEERTARKNVGRTVLQDRAAQARDFALSSPTLSLADSMRVLAWIRWAANDGIAGFGMSPRAADATLTTLELRTPAREEVAGRQRADLIRAMVE
ncbi:MAG: hypothetical protein P4L46_24395 [Fimbriimonas sp.]|nr:hypothetical protein [Fimbriimonas sp.]